MQQRGGVYDYFPQGQMVKAFNEFAFEKSVGTRGVVKTEFGYHLIEVLGQKGSVGIIKSFSFSNCKTGPQ